MHNIFYIIGVVVVIVAVSNCPNFINSAPTKLTCLTGASRDAALK